MSSKIDRAAMHEFNVRVLKNGDTRAKFESPEDYEQWLQDLAGFERWQKEHSDA